VKLDWQGSATLEAADQVTGPWLVQPGVTSPAAFPITGSKKFYRLSQ
jgi:hypothetical protein